MDGRNGIYWRDRSFAGCSCSDIDDGRDGVEEWVGSVGGISSGHLAFVVFMESFVSQFLWRFGISHSFL